MGCASLVPPCFFTPFPLPGKLLNAPSTPPTNGRKIARRVFPRRAPCRQAVSPSALMCSGSRALEPYMKWFSIRSE